MTVSRKTDAPLAGAKPLTSSAGADQVEMIKMHDELFCLLKADAAEQVLKAGILAQGIIEGLYFQELQYV